ncbi:MAG: peptidoglycan DD-metalloendopeptidase family protein [Herpetosiphonaceae bacterium]|nr:peptidoglycan DD-metalloendopeptidase family protein [Herpetosiphonaceae bacterium]
MLPAPSAVVVEVPTRGATPTEPATQTKTVGDASSTVVRVTSVVANTGTPLPTIPQPRSTSTPTMMSTANTTQTPTMVVPTANTTQTPSSAQATAREQVTPTSAVKSRVYLFPVQPARDVSYGTCHHDYPATDIFTPVGSVFVAVTGGVVDFVSYTDTWEPQTDDPVVRGGLSVAMIGDDGIRYYGSHLSQIAAGIQPGVRVAAGQRLGLTGKTGDARFTPAHLHFGISRPTAPDDWRVRRGETSPYRYLIAWRRGINLTPVLTQTGEGAC